MRLKTDSSAPWGQPLRLLPLLAIFAFLAIVQAKAPGDGDGWRYLRNAENLLHGYFASPETLMFWNGPGYPILLMPMVAFAWPPVIAYLANAVFLYLAVLYFQGTLRLAGIGKRSLAYAYALAALLFLHGPLLGMIMTESLSAFLVCAAAYHYCRAALAPGRWHSWHSWHSWHKLAAGFFLGYLALTKVFFGYTLEAALPLAIGSWLWARRRSGDRSRETARSAGLAAVACAVGLAVCAPYLAHTWAKTGKVNLWGNSGGFQLYYMSLPEKQYYGDWLNWIAVLEHPDYFPGHADFIRETVKLDYVAQDPVFKAQARRHCREHPGKCLRNWRANLNRMVFDYPNTRYPGSEQELATGNRSFVYAFPFFLLLFLAVPGWLARGAVPASLHACLFFALVSLAGMSLVCAIPRQVFPLLPWFGLWCVAVLEKAGWTRGTGAREPGAGP